MNESIFNSYIICHKTAVVATGITNCMVFNFKKLENI